MSWYCENIYFLYGDEVVKCKECRHHACEHYDRVSREADREQEREEALAERYEL